MSYGKGVVLRKQYFVSIRSAKFAVISKSDLPAAFKKELNPKRKLVLMDEFNVRTALMLLLILMI